MINKRFKELRKFLKLTQAEFGVKIDKGVSVVKYYESGTRTITDGVLLRLQEAFNVNLDWLRTGNGEMFGEEPKPTITALRELASVVNDAVEVAYFPDVYASAGKGNAVFSEVQHAICLSKKWHKPNNTSAVIKVVGDSMVPALADNDLVMINRDISPVDLKKGKMYVFTLNNALYVKELKSKNTSKCVFTSKNDKYDDVVITNDDDFKILAIVKSIVFREI